MLGSPLYMSPEQAKGAKYTDLRTDIWSLGVVLYEMLAATTPYSHCESLGGLILEICGTPARSVQEAAPWVPAEAAAIVHRALTIDLNRRYATVADMLTDVKRLLPGGVALEQSVLMPMAPQRRAVVAPKLSATATGLSESSTGRPSAAQSGDYGAGSGAQTGGVAGGLSSSQASSGGRSKLLPWALGGVLVLGVGGFLAGRRAPAPPVIAAAPDVTHSVAAAAAAVTAARPAERIIEIRSVQLVVSPATASAEVDGEASSVKAGMLTLTGASGSVHKVRLWLGKNETTSEVVISEAGAVPNKIELDTKSTPSTATSAAKSSRPAAAAAAAAGAAAAPAPAPKPAAAPAAPNNPGVDRSFQ
jgi:serine/threonine-protein kinase